MTGYTRTNSHNMTKPQASASSCALLKTDAAALQAAVFCALNVIIITLSVLGILVRIIA